MTLAQERRARLADAIGAADLDALVVYGNAWQGDYLKYATGFSILEGHGLAVVAADGVSTLYVDSASEYERAAAETTDNSLHFAPNVARAVAQDVERRGKIRVAGAPLALVPQFVAATERGYALADGTALVDRLLMHKLPAEVACVQRAAQLADEAYVVFRRAAQAGRHQYELVAEVEAWLRERGIADNFMLVGSGGVDVRAVTPPSTRKLVTGDLVITELTPSVEGYYAQICRTLVVGKASDAQKRAFAIYIEALEAGVAAVQPGARAADVAKAENDVFRKHDLGEYVTSSYTRVRGHGLGLFADSKPHILENVETPLEPGMAFVVHPNTYNPNVGYIMLGDSVAVGASGRAEVLTSTARELFES